MAGALQRGQVLVAHAVGVLGDGVEVLGDGGRQRGVAGFTALAARQSGAALVSRGVAFGREDGVFEAGPEGRVTSVRLIHRDTQDVASSGGLTRVRVRERGSSVSWCGSAPDARFRGAARRRRDRARFCRPPPPYCPTRTGAP